MKTAMRRLCPPLILESEDDVRRYCGALQRKRLRDHARAYMDDYRSNFALDNDVQQFLDKQRCIVELTPAKDD